MGTLYKRGDHWYIDLRVRGKRVRRRVGRSKKVAELALKDAEVKAARDQFGFTKKDLPIAKFFEEFLEYSKATHRPTSTSRYQDIIKHFIQYLSGSNVVALSQITPGSIDKYKVYRKGGAQENGKKDRAARSKEAKANTINLELDALRMMFNLAIKWEYLERNPVKGITRLKVDDNKAPRFLTEHECERLLAACAPDLRLIYFTFLQTGMRKAELEHLQWSDFDLRRGMILIRHKPDWKPKSGERDIPMTDALSAELNKHRGKSLGEDYVFEIKGRGHSRNWLREQLMKVAMAAEIPDLTKLHTLRHTFASHLVMNGVDLPTVQKLMGHSDIETTMIYAHLAPEHLANAVKKLPMMSKTQIG